MLATGQAQAAFVCAISSWAGTVNLDQAEIAPSLHPTPASQQVSVHHQCPLPGPSCQSSFLGVSQSPRPCPSMLGVTGVQ